MQLSDYIVGKDCTVIEAMQKIEINAKGIVYVCDNNVICGSVTDGDIRRHILNNGSIRDNIEKIMNAAPIVCNVKNRELAYSQMMRQGIRSLPILDENRVIVDIVFWNKNTRIEKKQLDVPVVIMAGGKGTRLYPYTQILPKPLIPIGEKAITEHIMSRFEEHGCCHFDQGFKYCRNGKNRTLACRRNGKGRYGISITLGRNRSW